VTGKARILYGGSFDPPQLAHREVVEIALRAYPQARVLVIPAGWPPHKEEAGRTPAPHRLAMTRLAFAGLEGVEVSDEECRREGPSYTVDTLAAHRRSLAPGTPLYWLVGSDSLLRLAAWKDPHRILRLARILTVPRPGYPPERILDDERFSIEERRLLARGILGETASPLSSTEVREALRRGEATSGFCAPEVHAYILDHGLYLS